MKLILRNNIVSEIAADAYSTAETTVAAPYNFKLSWLGTYEYVNGVFQPISSIIHPLADGKPTNEWLMAMLIINRRPERFLELMVITPSIMNTVASNPDLRLSIDDYGDPWNYIKISNMAIGKLLVSMVGNRPENYTDMTAVVVDAEILSIILADTAALNLLTKSSAAMSALAGNQTAFSSFINNDRGVGRGLGIIGNISTLDSYETFNSIIYSDTTPSSGNNYIVVINTAIMAVLTSNPTAMNAMIDSVYMMTEIRGLSAAWTAFKASTALAVATVPTMTSNTTPRGVAAARSVTVGEAYLVFDGSDTTSGGGADPNWFSYDFVDPVYITRYNGITLSYIIDRWVDYSDDNTNWTSVTNNITDFNIGSSFSEDVNVYAGKHRYWRLNCSATDLSSTATLKTLQFTGFY